MPPLYPPGVTRGNGPTRRHPLALPTLDENTTGTVLLRLYVAGRDARSAEARRLCEQVVARCEPGPCRLEIVDVLTDPQQAERDRVLATPTLVRLDPPPVVRLIGGLWNADFVMEALQLNTKNEHPG